MIKLGSDNDNKLLQNKLFCAIMDNMHSNIYITDIQTDQIVYMNDNMKKLFQLENPEGCICWQVLQKNMTGRCKFCKIDEMLQNKMENPSAVWMENNTLTGRIYKNYDCLISWEGRIYHMQHSVDETDLVRLSESASMDELTQMLNRRTGKEQLERMMNQARRELKTIVVALYDVNELKKVNDMYGHHEGDRLLRYITSVTKENLGSGDLIFRLSGDEFVIGFYDVPIKSVHEKIKFILEQLSEKREQNKIFYNASFSYGAIDVYPEDKYTVMDVISRADEQMYIQKKNYHILKSKEKLESSMSGSVSISEFEYTKEKLYDALVNSTDDYIYVGNMKTGTFRYPAAMVEEFGLPGEIVENAAAVWGKLIHPHDEKMFLESNQEIADGRVNSHNIEYRAKNKNGEWVWLRCRGYMVKDEQGQPDLFAGFTANLGKKSQVDHLTGLYNKFVFEGEIKKCVIDENDTKTLHIMILNMDSFKNVNDLYNRSFGDEVIRITAQKIASLIPENARVYRMDGDEFGIIIHNGGADSCLQIFGSIQNVFQKQQEYGGKKYYSTMSAGCASYPDDADNYLDLIKYANYSLEHSKKMGKNRITTFSSRILSQRERKLELTELLRESIGRGFLGFSIEYQPLVDTRTKELIGAEALARWNCSKYGNVSPSEFIPLLESSGLIVELGKWIFKNAVAQCSQWRWNKPCFCIGINLSYVQLLEGDISTFIRQTLLEYRLPPSNVTMELTETYLVKEDASVLEMVNKIRKIGVGIAMDDFGTGYSSLHSLKSTPVDVVKIDRAFVKGITDNSFNVTFIKAITDLCHNVGIKVCLEGVENQKEYDTVKKCGMEFIQGYYFGRPIPAYLFEKRFL